MLFKSTRLLRSSLYAAAVLLGIGLFILGSPGPSSKGRCCAVASRTASTDISHRWLERDAYRSTHRNMF